MEQAEIKRIKKNIVDFGKMLWEKNLASSLNGNISQRISQDTFYLTGHKTCLGFLRKKDLIKMDTDGNVLEGNHASSERMLHCEIYKNLPDAQAIIHTHTPYINGYFIHNMELKPSTLENKLYLGTVKAVDQTTPNVHHIKPVIAELKKSNLVVLGHHGVVAVGKDLFECFCLIQSLEEAVRIDVISRIYATEEAAVNKELKSDDAHRKRYALFSEQQIEEIVRLVNDDPQIKELGKKTKMTMDLAIKCDETNQVYRFQFENGHIQDVKKDEEAEFVISAPTNVWKSVFNREIDPFVATTQKKMTLKGDFAKISKWYAPCSRIFELWQEVPVES